MTLNGIDVSGYQPANIGELVPFDFLVAKATEGTGYVSGRCAQQVQSAITRRKGFGIYHFADTGDAIAQADYFVDNITNWIGVGALILDWEGAAVAQGVGWVLAWLNRVYERTGVRPVVYMSTSVMHAYDWSPVTNAGFKLAWPAQYGANGATGYRNPGTISLPYFQAALWQYGSRGQLPGYAGFLDIDIFYGDQAAWAQLAAKNGQTITLASAPITAPAPAAHPSGATGQTAVNLTTYSWSQIQAKIGATPDGIPGPQTLACLKAFQTAHGLVADGIVGPATAHALFATTGSIKVDGVWGSNTTKALQSALGVAPDGDFGPISIAALQRYLGVKADGNFGPVSKEALQRHLGVAVDGNIGPITISAMQHRLNVGTF